MDLPAEIKNQIPSMPILKQSTYEQMRADTINETPGTLQGYECSKCMNRGYTATVKDGTVKLVSCECETVRQNMRRLEKSGLKNLIQDCTFSSYRDVEPWQKQAKRMAMEYTKDYQGNWFCALGSVGSGKTHLCIAISGYLLNKGKTVRYMLWRDDSVSLKSSVGDSVEYGELIRPLKYADVLYIDDFFKTESGKLPTTADINLAFEILNYRYNERSATIISSERSIDELLEIDEAVGSRIYQRSKDYLLQFKGEGKNWRLK